MVKFFYGLVASLGIFLAGAYFAGFTPLLLVWAYFLWSLTAYIFYAIDKKSSMRGRWRVPENRLHLLAFLGGWPGAIVAQQQLRHKTQKKSFIVIFSLMMLANITVLAALHSPWGLAIVHKIVAFFTQNAIALGAKGYWVRGLIGYF
jgi:uncharacterized membrane protein YsdA (DUF1294 family)